MCEQNKQTKDDVSNHPDRSNHYLYRVFIPMPVPTGALARHFLQVGDGAQQARVVDIRSLAAAGTQDGGRPEEAILLPAP